MAETNEPAIMIVEDEVEVRFIISTHLRASGYGVMEAGDGKTAIELAASRQPDLIILDVGLPDMDGVAVTRALNADPRTAAIPVIMLTARSGTSDIVRGLEAGAQDYLPKPFNVAELLALVRTVHRGAKARKNLDQLNTQLEAEVDVKTRRLQLLYDFTRDLNRADAREQVLDLLIRCVEQTIAARRIALFLKEEPGDKLICVRAVGFDPTTVRELSINRLDDITGQVVNNDRTSTTNTLVRPITGRHKCGPEPLQNAPFISASLETREGVIGMLTVTDKAEDRSFSEDEIDCVHSIADAAAIALDSIVRRIRLERSVSVLLHTVGHLAEYRDEETTLHIERVSKMARILAEQLRRAGPYRSYVTEGFIESLVQAAPMHDIGKVGIPDEILAKPGKLTEEEYQIMKTHTDIGRRVLSQALDPAHPVPLLQMGIEIAHSHHERYNGSGYPCRLAGDKIPLAARIIALVDAYDAITSHRRYQEARSHEQAVEIIRAEAGKHFDPVLANAFLLCHEQFDAVRARYGEHPEAVVTLSA